MSEEPVAQVDFVEVAAESVDESVAHERDITEVDTEQGEPYVAEESSADPDGEPTTETTTEPSDELQPPTGDVVNTITAAVRR